MCPMKFHCVYHVDNRPINMLKFLNQTLFSKIRKKLINFVYSKFRQPENVGIKRSFVRTDFSLLLINLKRLVQLIMIITIKKDYKKSYFANHISHAKQPLLKKTVLSLLWDWETIHALYYTFITEISRWIYHFHSIWINIIKFMNFN